jgi:hypothetical protein
VSGIGGAGVAVLDHLASDRIVTPKLNEPLEVTGTVPSDSPLVNLVRGDGLPYLAEGVRTLLCFRRENDTPPFYRIRAATLIMQVDDAAASDNARTRFTAWDPWQYMMSRPVLQSYAASFDTTLDPLTGNPIYTTRYVDGNLLTADGLLYGPTWTADQIVLDIIRVATVFTDPAAPAAAQAMFIDPYAIPAETCGIFGHFDDAGLPVGGYRIEQGTSVGQALQDLCATGYMDILFTPIYDPVARPGILCELEIKSQLNGAMGAGVLNYSAIFAWDRPGRSTTGMDLLTDGTGRANHVQAFDGQGGKPAGAQTNHESIVLYGEYWAQLFSVKSRTQAVTLAAQQLALRANGKQTLTVNPATGRAPHPWNDYFLGDAVPVYASNRLRQSLPPGQTQVERSGFDGVTNGTSTFVSASGAFLAGDVGKRLRVLSRGSYVIVGLTNSTTVTVSGSLATGTGLSWQVLISSNVPALTPPVRAWQRIYGIPVEINDNGSETVRELIVGPIGGPVIGGAPVVQKIAAKSVAIELSRTLQRVGGVNVSGGTNS